MLAKAIDKAKAHKKGLAAAVIVIAVLLILLGGAGGGVKNAAAAAGTKKYEASYAAYLEEHGFEGQMAGDSVEVDLAEYETEGSLTAERGVEGILTEGTGSITWRFEARESGFYHLLLGYIALPGTTSDIQRRILLDGEVCYEDLDQVVIRRWWSDEEILEKNHSEVRPDSTEQYRESEWFVEDSNYRNGEPLLFYLEEGEHLLAFETMKEPLEITRLCFMAKAPEAPYAEALAAQTGQDEYRGEVLIYQAERTGDGVKCILKSSQAINVQKNYSDSRLVPYHPYYTKYNTIGQESWENPGDMILWEIEAPEDGLYELTFKGRQSENRGVTSYRRLYINGEVPCREANAIGFDFSPEMNNYTVTDEAGEPMLFALKKGSNTIGLEVVMGPFGGIISEAEESIRALNRAYLSIIKLTGQSPSRFIDYQIALKEPEFAGIMAQEAERLNRLVDELVELTGEKGEQTALLGKMAIQAEGLADNPEKVIEQLSQLKDNISAVATWLVKVSLMPLELDSFMLSAPGAELPAATDTAVAGLVNGAVRFLSTFFRKTSDLSADAGESRADSIKAWVVSYGKEQAQIIQNLIDDSFTPEHEIAVKLQLIPADVVLRAALTGDGPDVVIGLPQSTVQDFAMRGASLDLSAMEGYPEVAGQYNASTLRAASYLDGVYGLAEQANFMMLFYRKDILDELGLAVPETWQDFIEMLPILQQNNYNAYLPNSYLNDTGNYFTYNSNLNFYQSLVYQYGGDVYEGEGSDYGIKSGLWSDAAMEAFKDYTDFYTNYGLETQVDFSNRFRTGEVAIGVVNYLVFNTLSIFAPEIRGLWSFAPVPGMEDGDGINNTIVLDTIQSVIMSQTDHPEAAWQFMKWWSSEETQLDFANTVEAVMGTAARYSSAMPAVLKQLPWSNSELEALLAQFDHTIGIPAVPGYYMTNRMISYSYSDVISTNSNPRESLYLNTKSINQELTGKREEFGLSVSREES